jgi:hypothetical protein
MKQAAIGVTWYRNRADYDRLMGMFTDRDVLPDTYEEWLKTAQDALSVLTLQGINVVKAYFDPDTFPDWCKANGHKMDADARAEYGSAYAALQHPQPKK